MQMIHASCTNTRIDEMKKQLNKNFETTSDWFVDNRPSIQLGKDKTKSILFASKQMAKKSVN